MGKKPDTTPTGYIKLVDLPRALIDNGVAGVTYTQCYNAAVNGEIPVERSSSGARWVLPAEKLPSVIRKFSLTE